MEGGFFWDCGGGIVGGAAQAGRSFSEGDAEGGAFAEVGMADEELAFVVLFNDTFGEAEAEAPASFFRGKARLYDEKTRLGPGPQPLQAYH